MTAVGYPCFTAIKQGGDTDSLVYGDLCGRMKVFIMKDSTSKSPKGNLCLFDSALDLIVDAAILREKTPQIFEIWHSVSGRSEIKSYSDIQSCVISSQTEDPRIYFKTLQGSLVKRKS